MHRRWVQRKASGKPSAPGTAIPDQGGAPLESGVRGRMERQLGEDLSGVKVFTGSDSARAAKGFGARAFTVDGGIHFNQNEYDPGSREGDRLLAHELTHVVQGQKSGVHRKASSGPVGGDVEVSQPGDTAEVEADEVGDRVVDRMHGGGAHGGGGGAGKMAQMAGGAKAAGNRMPTIGAISAGVSRKIFRAPEPGAAAPGANGGQQQQGGGGEQQNAAPGAEGAQQKSPEEAEAEATANEIKGAVAEANWSNVGSIVKFDTLLTMKLPKLEKFEQNAVVASLMGAVAQKKTQLVATAQEKLGAFQAACGALNDPRGATEKLSQLKGQPDYLPFFYLPELMTLVELKPLSAEAKKAWDDKTNDLVYNNPGSDLNYDANKGMDGPGGQIPASGGSAPNVPTTPQAPAGQNAPPTNTAPTDVPGPSAEMAQLRQIVEITKAKLKAQVATVKMVGGLVIDAGMGIVGGPIGALAAFGIKKLFEKLLEKWNNGRIKEAEGLIESAEKMDNPADLQQLITTYSALGTDARELKTEADKMLAEKKKEEAKGGSAAPKAGNRMATAPKPQQQAAGGGANDAKPDDKKDNEEEHSTAGKVAGAADFGSDLAEAAEVGAAGGALLSAVPKEAWEIFEHSLGKYLGPIGTLCEGVAVAAEWTEYFQACSKLKQMQAKDQEGAKPGAAPPAAGAAPPA